MLVIYYNIVIRHNNSYTKSVDITPTSKFGKNIKIIRKRKKISQGDIYCAVGLNRTQMINIETDKGNPTLATIEKIALALGALSNELLK